MQPSGFGSLEVRSVWAKPDAGANRGALRNPSQETLHDNAAPGVLERVERWADQAAMVVIGLALLSVLVV
jgi:hypothetical protein